MIAALSWEDLDRLVDEDPIGALERAWEEIRELRAENQRLRADLVDGVDESMRRGGQIAELRNDGEEMGVTEVVLQALRRASLPVSSRGVALVADELLELGCRIAGVERHPAEVEEIPS